MAEGRSRAAAFPAPIQVRRRRAPKSAASVLAGALVALIAVGSLSGCSGAAEAAPVAVSTEVRDCALTTHEGLVVLPAVANAMTHLPAEPSVAAAAIKSRVRELQAFTSKVHEPDLQSVVLQRTVELGNLVDEVSAIPPGGDARFAQAHATAFVVAWNTDFDAICAAASPTPASTGSRTNRSS